MRGCGRGTAAGHEPAAVSIRSGNESDPSLSRFHELTVYPSQANFLLVKLPGGVDGVELRDYLLSEHHLLIRDCGNKIGMTSQFLRFGVRPAEEVNRLVEGLRGFARSINDEPDMTTRAMELILPEPDSARTYA